MTDNEKPAGKSNWILMLFGLPFAAVGLAMLWFMALAPLLEARAMQDWTPVQAHLLEAQLVSHTDSDNTTTWRATARYRYSYGGNDYSNDRVALMGGSDNIGDFQQTLGAQLEQAQAAGTPVTVYVNPRDPRQAVISRELRAGQLVLLSIFGGIFALVGIALMVAGWRTRASATGVDVPHAPWLARREWNSPDIIAGAAGGAVVAWILTLVWCGISGVASVFAWDEFIRKQNHLALIVLLFDAVGVWLLVRAVGASIAAARFGDLRLHLEPHPGRIGGEVGGWIDLPLPPDEQRTVELTLSCVHVWTRRSGKENETRRDPLWSDTRHFSGEPNGEGTRIYFRFAVPAGLPASSVPDNDYHEWKLDLECALPGVDLSRDFELPVFAVEGAPAPSAVASRVRESTTATLEHLEGLMNLSQVPGGVAMDYRAGRSWKGGAGLFLFGTLFLGVPLFMIFNDAAFILVRLLFGFIFGAVALACMAGGVWMIGNRLQVNIDDDGLRTQRDLFGVRVGERQLPRAQLAGIVATRSGSMSSGDRVTVFYDLAVKATDGTTHVVGDGFRGYGEAQRAAETIGTWTRLPFLGEQAAESGFAARKAAYLAARQSRKQV